MSRPLLAVLFVIVTTFQIVLWMAAESRNVPAIQMVQRLGTTQGKVTSGAGELLDGRTRYVVRFEYEVNQQRLEGEEHLSLRQKTLPQPKDQVTVFYDTQTPKYSSLTDPRLAVNRIATMKILILGFGAFTYAFILVVWKSSGKSP